MHFKINLTMVSILVLVVFFNIPFYNNWVNTNLFNPQWNIVEESKHMSIEERRETRFGYFYAVDRDLVNAVDAQHIKDPVILLPPEDYVKSKGIPNLAIAEPAIFYYFTGHKAVWYSSPDVMTANCALEVDNGRKITLKVFQNKKELEDLLTIYKKYKLAL